MAELEEDPQDVAEDSIALLVAELAQGAVLHEARELLSIWEAKGTSPELVQAMIRLKKDFTTLDEKRQAVNSFSVDAEAVVRIAQQRQSVSRKTSYEVAGKPAGVSPRSAAMYGIITEKDGPLPVAVVRSIEMPRRKPGD